MIVIDASSLTKYVLREKNWEEIKEYLLYDDVVSIDLVIKEVLNAIWKHYSLLKLISLETAYAKKNILSKITNEGITEIESQDKYLDLAFELALENKITIYDALYIAQAIKKHAELLTSDEKQAKIAKSININTIFVP